MKKIFSISLFILLNSSLLLAQGLIRECTVNSSLPAGKLTFMAYNLGADPNMTIQQQMDYVPKDIYDATVYGDLYQWGRNTDGHEKRNSPTTTTPSSTDVPGHGKFIIQSDFSLSWHTFQNNNLWGNTKTTNDPCPQGWRMPTLDEWHSIIHPNSSSTVNTWVWNNNGTPGYKISTDGGVTFSLFLPITGYRHAAGTILHMEQGWYWSSSAMNFNPAYPVASNIWFDVNYIGVWSYASNSHSNGFACRCVKNYGEEPCTVNPVYNDTIYIEGCAGDSYIDENFEVHSAVQYTKTTIIQTKPFKTSLGCDSIITLHFTAHAIYDYTINAEICLGERYNNNGFDTIPKAAGIIQYSQNLKTINKCDSIVRLNLTVHPSYHNTIDAKICLGQTYNQHNFNVTPTQSGTVQYSQNPKTVTGCDSIITLNLNVIEVPTTNINATIITGEGYNQNGFSIPIQNEERILTDTKKMPSTDGCDSVVTLTLTVIKAKILPLAEICGDNESFDINFDVSDKIKNISVIFDEKSKQAGFVNIISQNTLMQSITVVLPRNIRPDNYSAKLILDGNELQKELAFNFTVLYPSSIIEQKWNDVLALLNDRYNGGYVFSDYQWYKNGEPIAGAVGSYFYNNGIDFDFTSEYRAKITRIDDGVSLFTCGVVPVYRELTKLVLKVDYANGQIIVNAPQNLKVTIWNILGIKISEYQIEAGQNHIPPPKSSGNYILSFETADGFLQSERIYVK